MRDSLVDLNFREIVDYGGQQPAAEFCYAIRPVCRGYCVSCEESDLLGAIGGRLDLMSHGCDSADFTNVLGPMPCDGEAVQQPVLFLLEGPGRDYGLGVPVDFRGFRKQPPVNHYYWTPNVNTWPLRVSDFNGNFYGPYFAYLMQRHRLLNVYITNLVKCKWIKGADSRPSDTSVIATNCMERYLVRELDIFEPLLALCFGRAAEVGLRKLLQRTGGNCGVEYLRHPAFIRSRSQTVGKSQEELVDENDDRVAHAIRSLPNIAVQRTGGSRCSPAGR